MSGCYSLNDINPDSRERAIKEPEHTEVEPSGRIRYWMYIPEVGKHSRVVTLEDGETVHSAFLDRSFTRKQRRAR